MRVFSEQTAETLRVLPKNLAKNIGTLSACQPSVMRMLVFPGEGGIVSKVAIAPVPKKKDSPPAPRRRWPWWFWLGLVGIIGMAVVCLVYGIWASSFDMRLVKEMPERSAVYDMDGKIYSQLQGENRVTVKLSEVSKYFKDALIAREDSRFYSHHGIDPLGIARAIFRNLTHGSAKEGASTLTQQLARNSYPEGLGQRKSLHRKLLEAFVASRIEQTFSKDEILEAYVNRIYFGSTVYGIETASQTYFGKHASELTLSEAALIAGLIRAPSHFSPLRNLKGAIRERDTVLDRMVKLEKISVAQAATAKKAAVVLSKKRSLSAQENYALDLVRRELEELLTDEQKQDGGLRVYTTIDPVLQKSAENALDAELTKIESRANYRHAKKADFSAAAKLAQEETPYLQGALTVVDNRSGGIRTVVGGRDFSESKYNRAIAQPPTRQLGSTFKPFVYAAAFARGVLPGTAISDGPLRDGEIKDAENWHPENSDGTSKGVLRAEEGLILSRNTMSVRIGDRAGLDEIAKISAASGIDDMPRLPAVYLGAFEGNVTEVTAAYSVFANSGTRHQTYIIERIDNATGETIYRAAHIETHALDPGVSWLVTSALMKVLERGTASSAKALGFAKPAAGKTGTTNEFRDAWFVGYTSSLTCGVWVGLDHPETIMPRGYGAALALPVWIDVMNAASADRYPAGPLRPSVPLQRVTVCATSGQLATAACQRAGTAYSIDLPDSCLPKSDCSLHRSDLLDPFLSPKPEERRSVPQSIFRSLKKFFGGE